MENIAILVDVQNVYYTTRDKYRSNFDYNQFFGSLPSWISDMR